MRHIVNNYNRRSTSIIKPWIFFILEIVLFLLTGIVLMELSSIFGIYQFNYFIGIHFLIGVLGLFMYGTQTIPRLHEVLNRVNIELFTQKKEKYNKYNKYNK